MMIIEKIFKYIFLTHDIIIFHFSAVPIINFTYSNCIYFFGSSLLNLTVSNY